jgi:hypothetical protein
MESQVTATTAIAAARDQLHLVLASLDARLEQQRGHEIHVPPATDAQLRERVVNALRLMGGE